MGSYSFSRCIRTVKGTVMCAGYQHVPFSTLSLQPSAMTRKRKKTKRGTSHDVLIDFPSLPLGLKDVGRSCRGSSGSTLTQHTEDVLLTLLLTLEGASPPTACYILSYTGIAGTRPVARRRSAGNEATVLRFPTRTSPVFLFSASLTLW